MYVYWYITHIFNRYVQGLPFIEQYAKYYGLSNYQIIFTLTLPYFLLPDEDKEQAMIIKSMVKAMNLQIIETGVQALDDRDCNKWESAVSRFCKGLLILGNNNDKKNKLYCVNLKEENQKVQSRDENNFLMWLKKLRKGSMSNNLAAKFGMNPVDTSNADPSKSRGFQLFNTVIPQGKPASLAAKLCAKDWLHFLIREMFNLPGPLFFIEDQSCGDGGHSRVLRSIFQLLETGRG